MANNSNLYSTTILKAFDILDCFKNDTIELGISEISSMVNLPASSVYRIIQTLEFCGLLIQNNETKKYGLGNRFLSLSGKPLLLKKYKDIVTGYMSQLAAQTRETINLAIFFSGKIANIYKVDSPHILRPNFSLNVPYPAHCTATGKIFLAELSDASLKWVHANNELDIPLRDFLESMHDVRKNGYAVDNEEFSPGLRCVAAPIRAPGDKVVFAMSVSAPVIRMDNDVFEQSRKLVMEYAERASQEFHRIVWDSML